MNSCSMERARSSRHMATRLITAWYNADTEGTYTYDVEKAKELLAEAGYA